MRLNLAGSEAGKDVQGVRVTALDDDLTAVREALGDDSWLATMLRNQVRGEPGTLDAYLHHLVPEATINETRATYRNYFVACERDGRPRVENLTRKLAWNVVDYCIPRTRIAEARRTMQRTGSTAPLLRLEEEARGLFTHLTNSGEGGELLLYMLLEAVLGIPQVLCKMPLKTSTEMHVHGADGVHATALDDGGIAVYWGESKLHNTVTSAVSKGMESLAELLTGDLHHSKRDMFLLRDHADLGDPQLTAALRTFFDEDDPNSTKVEFRGACLVGFDYDDYPDLSALESEMETQVRAAVQTWALKAQAAITTHKLTAIELEIFFVPVPSVAEFRHLMRKALGQ